MPVVFNQSLDFAVWYLEQTQLSVPPFDQHHSQPFQDQEDVLTVDEWHKWFNLLLLTARVQEKDSDLWIRQSLIDSAKECEPRHIPKATFATMIDDMADSLPSDFTEEEKLVLEVLGTFGIQRDHLGLSSADYGVLCTDNEAAKVRLLNAFDVYTTDSPVISDVVPPDNGNGFLIFYSPYQNKEHPEKIMDAPAYGKLPALGLYAS